MVDSVDTREVFIENNRRRWLAPAAYLSMGSIETTVDPGPLALEFHHYDRGERERTSTPRSASLLGWMLMIVRHVHRCDA